MRRQVDDECMYMTSSLFHVVLSGIVQRNLLLLFSKFYSLNKNILFVKKNSVYEFYVLHVDFRFNRTTLVIRDNPSFQFQSMLVMTHFQE